MATPLVAPAIANAFAALTGVRIRQLPMSSDRVLAVLKGVESEVITFLLAAVSRKPYRRPTAARIEILQKRQQTVAK